MSDTTENLEFENWVINYNIEKITQLLDYNFNTLSIKKIKIILKHDDSLIKELINYQKYKPNKFVVEAYADKITLENLQYFVNNGLIICDSVITIICSNNKVDCFQYLIDSHRNVFNLNKNQLTNIFVWGFKDIVRLALDNLEIDLDLLHPIITILIRKGRFEIIKIIKDKYNEPSEDIHFFSVSDIEDAIEYGNINMFKYIFQNCDMFLQDTKRLIKSLREFTIKLGKTEIFNWFNTKRSIYNRDLDNNTIIKNDNDNINLAIQYNRYDIAKLLINQFIEEHNTFPNIKISIILGNNNIELLNLYVENNTLNYGIKHCIMEWIELNNIEFEITDKLYQKVVKDYPNIEVFNNINHSLEIKKNNIKDIKDLLKNNTIISDDVIDTLISEYVWNY